MNSITPELYGLQTKTAHTVMVPELYGLKTKSAHAVMVPELYGLGDTPPITYVGDSIKFISSARPYVTIPLAATSGKTNISFEMTFSTTSTASNDTFWRNPPLFGHATNGSNSKDFGVCLKSGKLYFWAGMATVEQGWETDVVVNDGEKHHVALVSNPDGSIDLYCDDTVALHLDDINFTTSTSYPLFLGVNQTSDSNHCDFDMYDFRIWDKALTLSELNADIDGTEENLTLWYKPKTEDGSIPDKSQNGYEGIISGFPIITNAYTDESGYKWGVNGTPVIANGRINIKNNGFLYGKVSGDDDFVIETWACCTGTTGDYPYLIHITKNWGDYKDRFTVSGHQQLDEISIWRNNSGTRTGKQFYNKYQHYKVAHNKQTNSITTFINGIAVNTQTANFSGEYYVAIGMESAANIVRFQGYFGSPQIKFDKLNPSEFVSVNLHTQDGQIVDDCGNEWTTVGTPVVTENGISFDKSSYLALDTGFGIGGTDFTIDFWTKLSSKSDNYARTFSFFNNMKSVNPFLALCRQGSSDSLTLTESNTDFYTGLRFLDEYHHIALVYQHATSTIRVFLDGRPMYKSSRNIPFRIYPHLWINGSNYNDGKSIQTINNFRITNSARWTERFEDVDGVPVIEHFRYENKGTADSLIVSGTTVQTEHSKFGTAFYQTGNQRCFDIPQTDEIWVKFDVYSNGTTWRVFNREDGNDGKATGIDNYQSVINVWNYHTKLDSRLNNAASGEHTFLLHMISGSLLEYWVDGTKAYTYEGNVNNGLGFRNLSLQSDNGGAFFSNVIISDQKIGINDNVGDIPNPNTPEPFAFDGDTSILYQNPSNIDKNYDTNINVKSEEIVDGDTDILYERIDIIDADTQISYANEVVKNFDTSIRTQVIMKPFKMNSDVFLNIQNDVDDDNDTAIAYYQGSMGFESDYDVIRHSDIPFDDCDDVYVNYVYAGHRYFDVNFSRINEANVHFDTDIEILNEKYKVLNKNFDSRIEIYKQLTDTYGMVICKKIDLGKMYTVEVAISIKGAGYAQIRYGDESENMGGFADYIPRIVRCRYIQVALIIRDRVTAASMSIIPVPQEITVRADIPIGGKKVNFGTTFYGIPMVFPAANQYGIKVTDITESSCFVELLDEGKSVKGSVSLLVKR